MNQSAPPAAAVRRVRIMATVADAYGAVTDRFGLFVKAAAVPYCLSMGIVALSLRAWDDLFLSFLLMIFGFVPYTIFGVAWHRLTLLGPVSGAPDLIPPWKQRHWRFLWYGLAVKVLASAAFLPVTVIGTQIAGLGGSGGPSGPQSVMFLAAALVALIGLPYLTMRLSFVFPAVAVDESYGLRHSWSHTQGQGFRLLGVVALTSAPVLALIWVVGSVLGAQFLPGIEIPAGQEQIQGDLATADFFRQRAGAILFAQVVLAAINYLLVALVLSAISIAFRTATGWIPGPGAVAPRPGGATGNRG